MKRANALNGISVACSITHNNEVIVCNTITQYNNMVKSVTLSKSHLRKMAEKHHRLLKLTYTNLWTKQPVQQPVQKLKLSIFKKEKGRKLEGIGISKQNQLIKKKKKSETLLLTRRAFLQLLNNYCKPFLSPQST